MSRTLEEILARAGETGCDWMLTAEEAGLLRREVERLRARHHRASANPSEDPTEANHIEEIRLWLGRDPGPYQHEVDDARDAAAWLLAGDPQEACAHCSIEKQLAAQHARMAALETQLAEERAKLRCQEERFMWRHAAEKERADKAERELAEERENRIYVQQSGINAIARVAELQALVDAATTFEVQGVRLHKRRGDGRWDVAVDDGSGSCRNEKPLASLLDALAFARDLAAKEKEPTR